MGIALNGATIPSRRPNPPRVALRLYRSPHVVRAAMRLLWGRAREVLEDAPSTLLGSHLGSDLASATVTTTLRLSRASAAQSTRTAASATATCGTGASGSSLAPRKASADTSPDAARPRRRADTPIAAVRPSLSARETRPAQGPARASGRPPARRAPRSGRPPPCSSGPGGPPRRSSRPRAPCRRAPTVLGPSAPVRPRVIRGLRQYLRKYYHAGGARGARRRKSLISHST